MAVDLKHKTLNKTVDYPDPAVYRGGGRGGGGESSECDCRPVLSFLPAVCIEHGFLYENHASTNDKSLRCLKYPVFYPKRCLVSSTLLQSIRWPQKVTYQRHCHLHNFRLMQEKDFLKHKPNLFNYRV